MKKLVVLCIVAAACAFGTRGARTISLNSIDGGARWELCPQDDLAGVAGSAVSKPGFVMPADAVEGVVPGVTFAAYVAAGREENPEWGDNIYRVDEARYNRPFWYRAEFPTPAYSDKERVWLHFDNTHRYADFYVNGVKLSGTQSSTRDVKGHMVRTKYDITGILAPAGEVNAVAVLITDPDQKKRRDSWEPYGVTCSPSYMSAAGWDWMPYIPGRLSGITGNAYLGITGEVVMEDPWVRAQLPTNDKGVVSISSGIRNVSDNAVTVTMRGRITPGNIEFSKNVTVPGGATAMLVLDKDDAPGLEINNPRLWWPNGYGEQNLYTCDLECVVDGEVTDSRSVTFGMRRYGYEKMANSEGYPVWQLSVNGQRVFLKGGNWGISEYLLRCHGEEYERKIRLHHDMNFNMIRLWTGCVTDEEFYALCDRYGIMVWDDFWIYFSIFDDFAEPEAFRENAREKVRRLRNHPCIAVWCGANETTPKEDVDNFLRELIATEDGGDRMYKPRSNDDGLSGSGLWYNRTPDEYFESAANYMIFEGYRFTDTSGYGLRTELGMAAFPNFESVQLFIPEDEQWPLPDDETLEKVDDTVWNRHFFGKEAMNAHPEIYRKSVDTQYGESSGLEEFCMKAQMLNLECMKGMFEAWNDKMWNDASGVLIWMSNPAYPAFVWQTYDYYYDATGAYYGAKSGCEHVHIQWNSRTGSVKVINTSGKAVEGAVATAHVYDIAGREQASCANAATVSLGPSECREAFRLSVGGDASAGIRFVRLCLKASDGTVLSENSYWHNSASKYDYRRLAGLPKADIDCSITATGEGCYLITLENRSETVAFANRIRLVDPVSGDRILPAMMSDNYITLMPGEVREITAAVPVGQAADGVDVMVKQFLHPEFKGDGASLGTVEAPYDADVVVSALGNGEIMLGWGGEPLRKVSVVTPQGSRVFDGVAHSMETLRLPSPGIYIVAVEGFRPVKTAVR